jgi:hypothetical protein
MLLTQCENKIISDCGHLIINLENHESSERLYEKNKKHIDRISIENYKVCEN